MTATTTRIDHGMRMERMTRHACMLASIAVLAGSTGHAAVDSGPVGVVAEYRPAFARYALARGPTSVAARIGTVVQAGDRITLPTDGVLVVQLADQTTRRYSGPGTFEVPAVVTGNRLMAVLASIPGLFEEQHRRYGTAATRGGAQCGTAQAQPDPLTVPIVGEGARVVAGRHMLQLAWRGGCKPFRVEIVVDGGPAVAMLEAVDDRRVRLSSIDLPVGRYSLAITDAAGLRYEASIEAVPIAPDMPEEVARAEGSGGDVARGAWLAGRTDANWRLAAYEALRPSIDAGDALAVAVGESLLTGRMPPQ